MRTTLSTQHLRDVNFGNLMRIAVPIMLSQATETIMMFTDRLFLSRLGSGYLGAAMSGGLSAFVFSSLFIGTLGYLAAVTSQHFGAGKNEQAVRYVPQGVWLALAAYPVALLCQPLASLIFVVSGHTETQVELEFSYFSVLMYGSVFVFLKTSLAGYLTGKGRTRQVLLANFIGMALNIPFNYAFIYGNFGFPAMGIQGAALGTILGSLATTIILVLQVIRDQDWKKYFRFEFLRFNLHQARHVLEYGLPAGLETFINVMGFNLFLQFMHSYGKDVADSVTIAFNYDLVSFIPILGLGQSATTMVGYQIGAHNLTLAKKALKMNLIFAYCYAGVMVAVFLSMAPVLVGFFTEGSVQNVNVVPQAILMLRMAAIYTLADATQVVFSGGLRGAGDTKWVLVLSAVCTWSLAGTSFLLVRMIRVDPIVMWAVFVGHVVALGALMSLRYLKGKWMNKTLVEEEPVRP